MDYLLRDDEERAATIALASYACVTCGAYDIEPESCADCATPEELEERRDEPIWARAARDLERYGEVSPDTRLLNAIFTDPPMDLSRDGHATMCHGGILDGGVVVHLGRATANGWRS